MDHSAPADTVCLLAGSIPTVFGRFMAHAEGWTLGQLLAMLPPGQHCEWRASLEAEVWFEEIPPLCAVTR